MIAMHSGLYQKTSSSVLFGSNRHSYQHDLKLHWSATTWALIIRSVCETTKLLIVLCFLISFFFHFSKWQHKLKSGSLVILWSFSPCSYDFRPSVLFEKIFWSKKSGLNKIKNKYCCYLFFSINFFFISKCSNPNFDSWHF